MGLAADLSPPGAGSARVPERPHRRRVAIAAVIAAVGVAVIGVAAGMRAPAPSDAVRAEGAAPAFDLAQVGADGARVSLAQFAGRPLVVNFWASWCVPCRKEMPALGRVSEQLAGRVAFVGVNYQDERSAAAEFQRAAAVRYPSGTDPDGEVGRRYGVMGLPTTVLVDAGGRIVGRRLGEVSERELLDLVARAFGPAAVGEPS